MNTEYGSKEVAACAVKIAISHSKQEEDLLKKEFFKQGIRACGVNFGGEFIPSVMKIIERSVVSAKREGLIVDSHVEEGCVAGATREALHQLMDKAIGLNVGGKIGIARYKEHISVCVFFGIGLLHLNEIALGLGHRVLNYIEITRENKNENI